MSADLPVPDEAVRALVAASEPKTEDGPVTVVRAIAAPVVAAQAAKLRAAAEGRREYARGMEGAESLRASLDALLLQASTLDHAADVMEGDDGPLYGWLPSWRWTADMSLGARHDAREGSS